MINFNIVLVGKVPKVPKTIFENFIKKKMINFNIVLVGKVPKSSVFNLDCLENGDF